MVSNMEKHHVFKSLFEDNITQVSSIGGQAHLCTLSACATRRTFSGVRAVRGRPGGFLLTMDAVVLNCVTQFNIVWRVGTFPFLPMSKCRPKTRCVTVAESLFLKKRFHSKSSSLFRPTLHDDRKLQTALPSDVCFTAPPTKMSGMALNLNRLIVSAPPCIMSATAFRIQSTRMNVYSDTSANE